MHRRPWPHLLRFLPALALLAVATAAASVPALPEKLSATGLYQRGNPLRVDAAHLAFAPRYPLWSDGTRKQRWLSLPARGRIDASDPNVWDFPPGTRLWKTFGYRRPVETRMIERLADGRWRFAAYVWDGDGRDATLAPEDGLRGLAVADAPGGRYDIPSREDCLACHGGSRVPVLGLSLVQLSAGGDAETRHAAGAGIDLAGLVRQGKLASLPAELLRQPLRIPAANADERDALGYLHGNCGHCHNRSGLGVPVALDLAIGWREGRLDAATVLASAIDRRARYAPAGQAPGTLLVPGDADASLIPQRMRTRDPRLQMPPLGTRSVDAQGLALVERWINTMHANEEAPP